MKAEIPAMLQRGRGAIVNTAFVERIEALLGSDALQSVASATPIQRIAAPAEVAAAVVWLCSDAASFVTGFPMAVDGGFVSV